MKKSDFQKIKLVVFDFDGVFTDNRVYVNENGKEMVCCWRSDGIGLAKLKEAGIKTFVVSSEVNQVVRKRCE
jgi:3-deoxy-D-manno-octulosonate 8-phosphate phosphatase KdsC-like HAD superfamily phosphatase